MVVQRGQRTVAETEEPGVNVPLVALDTFALQVQLGLGGHDGLDIVGLGQGVHVHVIVDHQQAAFQIGNGRIGSVIDGTNWIINNKDMYNIRVANISFGTTPNNNIDIENTLNLIRHVENMWRNGIVVVAAAGNNGPAAKSITAPGTSHIIITVGSMDDKTFHSGRGPTKDGFQKPELVVAGSNITACSNRKNGYSTKSGTSMSAPIVSGAIARLLTNHDLTPEEVRSRLKKCCNKVNLPHNQQGWGHLDIIKFITMKT